MLAYVNEVYLAQDGSRAVHGFGLASQYYFGKPLTELELEEIALLVALVRGPSYYDPRKHPDRVLARRNLVLEQMAERGAASPAAARSAARRPLGVIDSSARQAGYYPAFMDLVRRQLREDYPDEALTRRGLRVFATLDPATQAAAEQALVDGIDRLEGARAEPALEGAAIVTNPHTGDVLALLGGRRSNFDGFNRALDARRQVGSLIKPMVYLAALESGSYTLASVVEDAPIDVPLANGTVWSPQNFGNEVHGRVPLVRALAESMNTATVRVGLDIGIDRVAELIGRTGRTQPPDDYPSLLLGSIAMTPLEVAQMYNSLANGGFRVPLRAVQAVVDGEQQSVERYPLEIGAAADPRAVYQLNQALVQVMERGTGRLARRKLPADLTVAGKTGTSDELRDSWFAGFGNDRLAVIWLGADRNESIGLTGSTGAASIAAELIDALKPAAYRAMPPAELDQAWIDYVSGAASHARCAGALAVPIPKDARHRRTFGCPGGEGPNLGTRLRSWLEGRGG
jgi:penicillin-binding protein 1B